MSNPLRPVRLQAVAGALTWMIWGIGATAQAAPVCPEPVSSRAFHQQVSSGDAAYAEMDMDAFQQSRVQVRKMVPCLAEPITPAQAAGYHRLEALGSFLGRDHAGAVASLRAVIAAAPGYQLSLEMAPDGHPLRTYFMIAEGTPAAPAITISPQGDGWLAIDGVTSTDWPVDRPYLVQSFDGTGQVSSSALRSVGEPPLESTVAMTAVVSPKIRTARTLSIISGGAAIVAGGLYLGARSSANQFWEPTTPTSDLGALRSRTNTLGWASAGMGFVAMGTGGAALLVGTW